MKKAFPLVYSAILALTLLAAFTTPQPTVQRVNVYIVMETAHGTETIATHNVITDIGEIYARNILGWNNVTGHNATQWIALGNASVSQTDTKLDTEATSTGFTRAANDSCTHWINSGDYAYNVTKKFTATGAITINATALQWSGVSNSDNNAYAIASLGGSQGFENNWNCTITWAVTYNFN